MAPPPPAPADRAVGEGGSPGAEPAPSRLQRVQRALGQALAGIRGRMIMLLMVAGIPVVAIALGNALNDRRTALLDGRREIAAFANLVATRYAASLGASETLLTLVAREDPLAAGPDCGARLRRVVELHPGEIAELGLLSDGRLVCGGLPTGFDAGTLAREALASGAITFGAFLPGGPGRAPIMPLAMPAPGQGAVLVGMLILREDGDGAGGRRAGGTIWLLDREGRAVSPTGPGGRALDPAIPAGLGDGGQVLEAEGLAFVGARLNPGLQLVVAQPLGPAHDAARGIVLQRLVELSAFLIACLTAIIVGADIAMVRPLRNLAARVRNWRPGHAFRISPAGTEPRELREVEQAFSEAAGALARREADLRAALDQRDALMGEIHHRVKNNLQIVSSLLNLQAGRIGDPAAAEEFLAARNRVRTLATLHSHLYTQHSFEEIAMPAFLSEVANQQFNSHNESPGERIGLSLEVAELGVATDQAAAISLLVTEAVGNALEHAFPEEQRGRIRVALAEEQGIATLEVEDDGIGLPPRGERPRGLGLQLIEGFAKQLGGALAGGAIPPGEGRGTRWTVRFHLRDNPAPRAMGS